MKTLFIEHKKQPMRDLLLCVSIGGVAAASLTLSMRMESKWTVFILLILVSFSVLMAIPKREKFLLYLAVFFLPIGLDFHLFHINTSIMARPINGFRISAYDMPFFFLVIFWLSRVVFDYRSKIKFYPVISIPFLCIWAISMASLSRTQTPTIISVSVLWIVFKNWIVFLYIANNLKDRKTIYHVTAILILTGVLQSLIGLAQHVTGGILGFGIFGEAEKSFLVMKAGAGSVSRVAGTLGHPNKLAVFLGMLIQINLALFFAPISKKIKYLLALSFVLMCSTMILTFSRGGWLGLAFGGSITCYWCLAKRIRNRVISAILLIVFISVFAVSSITLIDSVRKRLFEEDYGTAKTRIPMGITALNIIRHYPWLGVGFTNYVLVAPRYDISAEGISYHFPRPVHNEFLLIAAELGIPALLLFLMILTVIFWHLLSLGRSRGDPVISYLAIGFFGGWVGWCLHHQFEYLYSFLVLPVWVYYFGFIQALREFVKEEELPE